MYIYIASLLIFGATLCENSKEDITLSFGQTPELNTCCICDQSGQKLNSPQLSVSDNICKILNKGGCVSEKFYTVMKNVRVKSSNCHDNIKLIFDYKQSSLPPDTAL